MPHTTSSPLGTRARAALCLGALGVVFGDIGTSPLYTMRECVAHLPAVGLRAGILGILSLILWSFILVVSIKYLMFITKADNNGEGGIFALLALIRPPKRGHGRATSRERVGLGFTVVMILVGAALLYGDGIITPAISVLGAAEGLSTVSGAFTPYIVVMACAILAGLFWMQHKGTDNIGKVFGPVMLVWFVTLGLLGAWQVARMPWIIEAANPRYAVGLLWHAPGEVTGLLGAIVLAITGAEALYADMGHFGRRYIAWAWYGVAFPGLVLNYFGQGAWLLAHPGTAENPFFALATPGMGRALLTGLSIVAAVIASQALISGAYSLTRQAIQLGYFPRLQINYTNMDHFGQIYVPFVNTLLAVGCIATVAAFKSSDALASAYGVAVTGTMGITSIAYFIVARRTWGWSLWKAGPLCAAFLVTDAAFFLANVRKIADGGWYPLAIGAAVLAVMHTWKRGKDEILRRVYSNEITESELCAIASSDHIARVKGTAVFMAGNPRGTPLVLLHHVKANKVLHETVIILSISTDPVPVVKDFDRLQVTSFGCGIWRAVARYGYMESPDVAALIGAIHATGVPVRMAGTTYYFNREMIMTGGDARMWNWEKHLYGFLSRNARQARDYYRLPPMQIIEVGLPIQL